jgi:hypothetical protein
MNDLHNIFTPPPLLLKCRKHGIWVYEICEVSRLNNLKLKVQFICLNLKTEWDVRICCIYEGVNIFSNWLSDRNIKSNLLKKFLKWRAFLRLFYSPNQSLKLTVSVNQTKCSEIRHLTPFDQLSRLILIKCNHLLHYRFQPIFVSATLT